MRHLERFLTTMLAVLVLVLLAAACGSDNDDASDDADAPAYTVPQAIPTPEGTPPPDESIVISSYTPGSRVQTGLAVEASYSGQRNGRAFYYAILRNESGDSIAAVRALLYALDDENYVIAEHEATSLLADIPPGQTFFIGGSYPVSDLYTASADWVLYDTGEPRFEGYFDLPVTITYQGIGDNQPYLVRGTVENTSGQTLQFPVVDALLIGPDGQPAGLAHGRLTSLAPGDAWAPGVVADFEAAFDFTAFEPPAITDARVQVSGYVPLGQAPTAE